MVEKGTAVGRDKPAFPVGSYVDVTPDLRPGKCSHGGTGWLTNTRGAYSNTLVAVKYDACAAGSKSREETDIPGTRVTIVPIP